MESKIVITQMIKTIVIVMVLRVLLITIIISLTLILMIIGEADHWKQNLSRYIRNII